MERESHTQIIKQTTNRIRMLYLYDITIYALGCRKSVFLLQARLL